MSEDRRRILKMLAEGKITVDEADGLLTAFAAREAQAHPSPEEDSGALPIESRAKPKYVRVLVEPSEGNPKGDRVNIRVPVGLLRAGVKLASLMPSEAQNKVALALKDKGINLDMKGLTPEQFDELVECLAELSVEVDGEKEKVRVFCE
jgi:hypothetical protein